MLNSVIRLCVCVCVSCLVVSDSLQPQRPQPTRPLCPWDSPDKNTGVGCHFLLQGIFLTQGSNPYLSTPAEPGEWTAVGLVLPHFHPLIF